MILYILSIIVFIAIASLIGFLLGRASVDKRLTKMEDEIMTVLLKDKELERNHQELLDQLKIQGRELESTKIREQKLEEILQKLNVEKKHLAAESIENKDQIQDLRKRLEELADIKNATQSKDREALRWRNEYVRLNYALEDKLRRIEREFSTLKENSFSDQSTTQEKRHEPFNNNNIAEEGFQNAVKGQELIEELKNKLTDQQIKTKRQEHIIRALRLQLKNLNIEKIRMPDGPFSNEEIEDGVEDESKGVDISDIQEEVISENDFKEAIDEIVGQADELFPESMNFKERKLRKTGDEVLDFTKVYQTVKSINEDDGESAKAKVFSNEPEPLNWNEILGPPANRTSNLSLIFNMDSRTEKALKSLGINSFEQLSNLKDDYFEALEKDLNLSKGTIASEKWVEQAGNLSSEENINSIFLQTRSNTLTSPVDQEATEKDLTAIRGIGRTYKKRLNNAGIDSIKDLANWESSNLEELAALIAVPLEKIERERWLDQAKQLVGRRSQPED